MMDITRTSVFSGITRSVLLPVTQEQMTSYENGVSLQEAFPNLSPDAREFIKTGITTDEWEEIFGEEKLEEKEDD